MSSYLNVVNDIKNSPDNIYFNVAMTNSSNQDGIAVYTANKTQPIVQNAEDYYLSIVSFSIPLDALPMLIMPILTTNGNINLTPLIIGIYDPVAPFTYWNNLIFQPEIFTTPPVIQSGTTTQIITPYHYVYNYQTLLNMMNQGLQTAYAAYVTANPLSPLTLPFFVYDPSTTLISLIADYGWISGPAIPSIIVNRDLSSYIDSMFYKVYPSTIPNESTEARIQVQDLGSNGYPLNLFPATPGHLKMTMNYSTMFLWASLKKILITTNSIPINFEQAPILNNLNPDQYNTFPILADFTPSITAAGDSREIAFYFSNQYRLIDLNLSGPLNKINFQIYWQDTNNNLYPLFISPFQEAAIKFVFSKKNLYKKN